MGNMKKISVLLGILLMGILLTGCMSFKLPGGDTLEISTDGIKVIEVVAEEADEGGGSAEVDQEGNTDETPVQDEVDEEGTDETDEEEFLIDEGFGGCQNEFYLLQNRILEGFPLTPCPEFSMIEINKSADELDVRAEYEVNVDLYYEYNHYLDFFVGNGYTMTTDRLRVDMGIMEVSDENMKINLGLAAIDRGLYYGTTVDMTYSESPVRNHPIVDSIVNQDDTSDFGKCADEYYVLKDNLVAGFPFDECIDISFLSIVFGNQNPDVNTVYNTSGPIEDVINKYQDFFIDNGNNWTTDHEGIDDADAVTTANVNSYDMAIKYVAMANGKVGIQLFSE